MCCYLMMINTLPRLGSRMLWSDPTTPSRSFLMRGAPRDGRSKSTWHIVVVMRPHLAVVVTRRLDWSPWRARRRAVVRPCGSWACRDRAPASNGRTCPPASGRWHVRCLPRDGRMCARCNGLRSSWPEHQGRARGTP
jgi:hypothetical protein